MKNKSGRCFSCCKDRKLSKEHIIPQALGGRLSAYIYCQECNNSFGRKIDAELINRIGFYGTCLGIKRSRGKNQSFAVNLTKDGTKLTFDGQGFKRKDPEIRIEKEGEKITYYIKGRSEPEVKKIISGIKKKSDVPIETGYNEEYHPGPTDTDRGFMIDNENIRRCVAKIAYSFLCTKVTADKIFSSSFDEIRNYILSDSDNNMAAANYTPQTAFLTDYTRPLHRIHISMNREKKLVIGFICLFGTFRYTVLLSRNFESSIDWAGLDHTIDPLTSKCIPTPSYFKAPNLDIREVISPQNSKQRVVSELYKGFGMISKYNLMCECLKIEAE